MAARDYGVLAFLAGFTVLEFKLRDRKGRSEDSGYRSQELGITSER